MSRHRRIDFFKSNKVTWRQGVHLQRARWHNCMQWGWSKIETERWADYWVLHFCWRNHGVCWHYYPKAARR